ncbi:MAG: tRNA threonylcarbamoyladenosine dehydratase [Burkholderiaceae bacterium]
MTDTISGRRSRDPGFQEVGGGMQVLEQPRSCDPRQFSGILQLYGERGLARLQASHVVVAGIGGVGSWAAEALVRSGIGRISLIDMDHISVSNINRQVHALHSTLGASKIEVMAERLRDIRPDMDVQLIDDFLTLDNLEQRLDFSFDGFIDAIDQVSVKAALIAYLHRRATPMVVCGAAGGRVDPLLLKAQDLAFTTQDALLANVRARLRKHYDFPRDLQKPFAVTAIHSSEVWRGHRASADAGSALACSGFGSSMMLTASMGLASVVRLIEKLMTL